MRRKSYRWPKMLLGFFAWCLLPVSIGLAQECLSPSPTTLSGKKSYDPIETRELTPDEHRQTVTLFKSLAGDWRGTADTFFCRSISDPRDVERGRLEVRADVDVDYYGNLLMAADFYDPVNRTRHQETLRLYLNNNRLRIDHDTGAGDVELIELGDQVVAFLFRRVIPTGGTSGSSRSETFFTLRAGRQSLTIEQQVYVQAKLSSGHVWRLQR